jgi:hypothetical protein
MDHATLLVQVPDTLGDLADDMASERFGKVCELDNLVEQFATLHD